VDTDTRPRIPVAAAESFRRSLTCAIDTWGFEHRYPPGFATGACALIDAGALNPERWALVEG
jgi:hypothetical protein